MVEASLNMFCASLGHRPFCLGLEFRKINNTWIFGPNVPSTCKAAFSLKYAKHRYTCGQQQSVDSGMSRGKLSRLESVNKQESVGPA
jgi:hypothetical protein